MSYKSIISLMPKPNNLLLDLYPGASVAYSLRKLRSGYTGNAVRVRRTDLAEQDIGFNSDGVLDTVALLAFVGITALDNGFVTTWYDQSGNGNNAKQAALASQPRIVEGGVLVTDITTGKPSVRFLNAGFNLTSSVRLTPIFVSSFVLQKLSSVSMYLFGTTNTSLYMMGIGGTGLVTTNIGSGSATPLQSLGSMVVTRILSMTRNISLISGYNNGVVMPNTRSSATLNTYNGFGRINSLTEDGYISEGVWWNQDYLALIGDINTEINEYYGIY